MNLFSGAVEQVNLFFMHRNGDQSDPSALVEPSSGEAASADLTTHALHLRIRQQEILGELGVLALQGTPFLDLLNHTARLTAQGMEAEFSAKSWSILQRKIDLWCVQVSVGTQASSG
jgi:hypothetical protein